MTKKYEEKNRVVKGVSQLIDGQVHAEGAADNRHDHGEATADQRCCDLRHKITSEAWQIIFVIMAIGILFGCYEEYRVYELHNEITKLKKDVNSGKNNGEVVVWFNKQRQYSDKKFQQVDIKYPAQYERWSSDGSVIERWHWRVEGQPATYRFGDRIQRCVAVYQKGIFVGYIAYSMEDYPTDDWEPAATNKIKNDSLVLQVIGSRKEIRNVGGIGWSMIFEEGEFKCLKKNDLNGVKKTFEIDLTEAIGMFNLLDYDRDDLYQICLENEDLQELHFTALLQENEEDFKRYAAALPLEKKWNIYAAWCKAHPDTNE